MLLDCAEKRKCKNTSLDGLLRMDSIVHVLLETIVIFVQLIFRSNYWYLWLFQGLNDWTK